MLNALKNHLCNNFSFINGKKLLICVSGGVDSMVLLKILKTLNYNVSAAHCNFKLRGIESDADCDFVKQYCNLNKIDFYTKEFDTSDPKYSVQMSARKLRYEWFYHLLHVNDFDYIVTAHHLDDSLETFLINLSRSTGIDGLRGIKSINDKIIRPLLIFNKSDIIQYANLNKLEWREDSSNKKNDYLRNKIRNTIIPKLKELNPNFLNNFSKTLNFINDDACIIEDYVSNFKNSNFIINNDITSVDKIIIKDLSPSFVFKLFKEYGFKNIKEIFDLCYSISGKIIKSESHYILSNRKSLLIRKIDHNNSTSYFYNNLEDHVLPNNILIEEGSFKKSENKSLYLDKKNISFPIIIRTWKKGDYIYPTGMNGKKLISKLYKDKKLSTFDKENQFIIEDGDHILWVVGMRFDKRKYKNIDSNLKISIVET